MLLVVPRVTSESIYPYSTTILPQLITMQNGSCHPLSQLKTGWGHNWLRWFAALCVSSPNQKPRKSYVFFNLSEAPITDFLFCSDTSSWRPNRWNCYSKGFYPATGGSLDTDSQRVDSGEVKLMVSHNIFSISRPGGGHENVQLPSWPWDMDLP